MRFDANQIGARQRRADDISKLSDVSAPIDHAVEVQRAEMRTQLSMPLPHSTKSVERPGQKWNRIAESEERDAKLVKHRVHISAA